MTAERWRRILRMLKETFSDYETGLVALRKRVVDDMRRKLKDGADPDHARRGARARSAPATKRR